MNPTTPPGPRPGPSGPQGRPVPAAVLPGNPGAPPSAHTGPAAQVMLLSLCATPGAAWHARLVEASAQVHDFDSPFELARFLARSLPPAPPAGLKPPPSAGPLPGTGSGGLR